MEKAIYQGLIRREFIKNWVHKTLEPLVKAIGSLSELEYFISSHELVVLTYGFDNLDFLRRISLRFDRVFFVVSDSGELRSKYPAKVTFFRGFDRGNQIERNDLKGLQSFIERYQFKPAMRVDFNSKNWLLSNEEPVIWLFIGKEDNDEVLSVFETFARNNQKNMASVLEDGSFSDSFYDRWVRKMDVSDNERPCIRLTRGTETAVEVFSFNEEEEITLDTLKSFVDRINAGIEKPIVSDTKELENVKFVDDKGLQELIFNVENDSVIMFVTEGCEFCRKVRKKHL